MSESALSRTSQTVLTDEQVAAFHRQGFLIVRGLFDAAEMRRIGDWVDEVQALPEAPGKYMIYFEDSLTEPGKRILCRTENFVAYHQGLRELVLSDRMLGAVEQLFGEPALLFKEKINFKMPGGGGFKPHQDQQAGWGTYADLFITILVSVDEATVENGCLELAAGHHARGLVGNEWEPLSDEQMAGMEFVPCPTKPGDAVFFDSFAPHRSALNGTDKPRRVLYVSYNRLREGDHRDRYYADKRQSYPPDCEREEGKTYVFRV